MYPDLDKFALHAKGILLGLDQQMAMVAFNQPWLLSQLYPFHSREDLAPVLHA